MNSYPQKNSADALLEDIGAFFAGNLFLQRHGGIQFIPSDKSDPYLGGGEYGHLFDDPSDEVIVKFSEAPVVLVIYNRCIKI